MPTYHQRQVEQRLREEVVRVCRLLWEKGYLSASDGNVSVRLSDNRLLTTPTGLSKGFLQPEQLVITDLAGQKVRTFDPLSRDLAPSSELRLHLEVYRQRADVQAVVHAHPPRTIALSIAGIPVAACLLPEVVLSLGTIPTTEYATPATAEGPAVIRDLIADHDALVLQRHGTLTVGRDLWEAYLKQEKVEHAAEITMWLRLLGRDRPMSSDQVAKLLQASGASSPASPGRERAVCEACGLCALPQSP